MRVAERQAFLAAACAGDQALRTELEALLGSDSDGSSPHGSLGSASDAPAGGAGRPRAATPERLAAAFAVFRDYRARQDAGTAEPVEALLAAHAELRDDLLPLLQPDGPSGVAGASLARSLLERALDLPAAERAGFLDRACGGDIALREDVEQLLVRAPKARPDPPRTAEPGNAEGAGGVPVQIGPYRILGRLGEGGMGTVYLAEQKEPVRRRVALKVIKLGMDSKAVVHRFEAERQALAMMEHGNIARVYECGLTESGQPYFAMEYVKGIPIHRYCDDNKLSLDERLALFRQVCSGVQHAHNKGVIHRDLTPKNVLVTVQDGRPTPKIIDFGLARATDHRLVEATIFTEQGQIVGTPEYMSPEQAGLGGLDIDTRTDVYTLGVLLYELLVGTLPFPDQELRRAGWMEMQRRIREVDPPKPSTRLTTLGAESSEVAARRRIEVRTLRKRLRDDLDWVVMKALEQGPDPALRDGERVRGRRAALPAARAGAGGTTGGRIPGAEVRAAVSRRIDRDRCRRRHRRHGRRHRDRLCVGGHRAGGRAGPSEGALRSTRGDGDLRTGRTGRGRAGPRLAGEAPGDPALAR
ncbi:MAG: serine/threonine protein kinase [Planctomycetes bacterium]|nr:serine/threonine protein kinase [Planctomycetota bacterium]